MDEEGYLATLNAVLAGICDTLYQKICADAEQVKTEFGHYMGLVNESYVSNWQWGGSKIENQGVHGDHGPLWETMTDATPTFKIVINYPICDYTEENGTT